MLPNSHTGLKRKSKVKGGKKDQNKRRRADSSDDEDDPAHVPLGGDDVSDLEDENPSLANGEDDDGTNPAYLPAAGTTSTSRELQPPNRPGTLLITLLDQAPYTLWALRQLATRPPASIPNAKPADRGPQPRYALLRSFQFVPQAYPGYAHRRTLGFKEGLSKSANEEIVGRKGVPRTWEFALNPKVD
jgi:25S rRNA (uracil2634-N3)-methyltransferase